MENISRYLSPDQNQYENVRLRSPKAKQPAPEGGWAARHNLQGCHILEIVMDIVKPSGAGLSSASSLPLSVPSE